MELFRNLVGDQQPGEVPRSEPDSDPYRTAASSVPPDSVGGTSQARSLRPSTRNRTKEASKAAGTKYFLFQFLRSRFFFSFKECLILEVFFYLFFSIFFKKLKQKIHEKLKKKTKNVQN